MATKKRSSILNKNTSRSSGTLVRRERSSISSRQGSNDETFEMRFERFCIQFGAWTVPNVRVINREPSVGVFPKMHSSEIKMNRIESKRLQESKNVIPEVLVLFDTHEMLSFLNTVILKRFRVDRGMLIALRKSFEKFNTVTILKLEYCQFENTDLRTLKTILQKNRLITELSMDGNPNRFQNFYILLKDTQLEHLSMRFCQINDRGAKLIAAQLSAAFEQTLISIDLSSNFISDEGTASIAHALRINRVLLSLNLCNNWITDTGCASLLNILSIFTLNPEEIFIRRARIFNHLSERQNLIEQHKQALLRKPDSQTSRQSSSHKRTSKDSGSETRRENRKASKGSSQKRDSASNQSKKYTITCADIDLIIESVNSELTPDEHPFVRDCYAENDEIYCKGNLQLINLNLAYNKITEVGLLTVIEMLKYQGSACKKHEGLSHLLLEGNSYSECCTEINEVNYLMDECFARKFSSLSCESRKSYKRRKSGHSKVSIAL